MVVDTSSSYWVITHDGIERLVYRDGKELFALTGKRDEEWCEETETQQRYICNRPKGHKGAHIAFGSSKICAVFPRTK